MGNPQLKDIRLQTLDIGLELFPSILASEVHGLLSE